MTEKAAQKTMQELTVEESFSELDRLVQQMESGEVSLEESFQLYARGMQLLKNCSDKIDLVEKKMLQISEDGTLVEF
ncbi:MAG: exodeoxyribonuclease VII small subunit [Lachnospiraceae bacterium]|nr:exodeoxyribonuclease VII small subunit [Lachnospiraceae bacterium]